MSNLQKVFHKFINCNKDVLILLDDTFCFSKEKETGESNKKSMSITSISDRYDIIECLKEEGSAVINYKISSKGNTKQNNKILNSLISVFIEFNFEPYIMTLINNEVIVSVVISDNDIDFIDDFEDTEEYEDSDQDEYDEDVDDDYYGKDEQPDKDEEELDDNDEGEPDNDEEEPDKDEEEPDNDEEEPEETTEEISEPEKDEEEPEEATEEISEPVKDEPEPEPVKDEETEEDEDDDESEPEVELSSLKDKIRLEINNNFEKLKRPRIIEYMKRLKIKKVNGAYIKLCKKKELCDYLIEFLEN
jgi:hypothetical protein